MRLALTVSMTLLLGFTTQVPSLAAQVEQSARLAPITAEEATTRLRSLIDQPAPAGLSASDLAAYQAQTEWLRGVRARLDVAREIVGRREAATGQASGRGTQTSLSMSKEYEEFQKSLATERVTFLTTLTKARHDQAMKIINNIRA
jgi:hypothetical protein